MKQRKAHVFVVDDDESVRKSLVNLLEIEDYAVETFAAALLSLAACANTTASTTSLEGKPLSGYVEFTGDAALESFLQDLVS
jgi:CheY-like chemotaxis protein